MPSGREYRWVRLTSLHTNDEEDILYNPCRKCSCSVFLNTCIGWNVISTRRGDGSAVVFIMLHATCELEGEIALTYISSVSRRSAASASPRICSHYRGVGWRAAPSARVCVICDELSLWTSSEAPGARGPSAPSGGPSRSCRGCAAGEWRAPWSSHSERGGGTRVSGRSLHPVSWSNLTRCKNTKF